MTPEINPRRIPRAAHAVRTVRIARTLHNLVPDAAVVRLTPVWSDRTGVPRMGTVVLITDDYGRPTGSVAAHRLARAVLRQQFTTAAWDRQQRYDVTTGRLTPQANPFGPRELTPARAGR
ncbi:hypothetical protein [Streptomyces chryseus]